MSKRKTTRKKTRRRRRQSRAEQFFGAVVIEGLGALAIVVLFVFARQASQPVIPEMAEVGQVPVVNQREADFIVQTQHRPVKWRVDRR